MTTSTALIGPRPEGLQPHLGELGEDLFDETIYACCELADRYASEQALALLAEMDLQRRLEVAATVRELVDERGYAETFAPALEALLDRLVVAGLLTREVSASAIRYRAAQSLRADQRAAVREAGVALHPGSRATFDLFDAAAAIYPAVAAGKTSGERELFGAGHIGLWFDYFSNENPSYVLNNTLTARVVANRVADRPSGRILEVGAGAGSATRALVAELARRGLLDRITAYDATEPSPFFRRRGERDLRASCPTLPYRSAALDLDRPFVDQGFGGPYDVIFGVNVLHVAHDLAASLAYARDALAPGGWLIAGECLRLFPDQPAPADLVFQLFEGFVGVQLDPAIRPRHGFLEPEQWAKALAAVGFDPVQVAPDLTAIRSIYPRFFAGVVAGRKPPATHST